MPRVKCGLKSNKNPRRSSERRIDMKRICTDKELNLIREALKEAGIEPVAEPSDEVSFKAGVKAEWEAILQMLERNLKPEHGNICVAWGMERETVHLTYTCFTIPKKVASDKIDEMWVCLRSHIDAIKVV
jgi:hypothetical protein